MSSSAPVDLSCPPCRFGSFELLPDDRRLLADGAPVALGARAFDLLVALVARAGQLVSKNDLLELVWPGLVVEENNLQVQVSALRKLLGPSALATIPGRGYRFALPVERIDGEKGGDVARSTVRPAGAPPGGAAPSGATVGATATAAAASTATPETTRARTNLPSRLPSLYGRAQDVETVKMLLAVHAVVTIAGAGGIGKTRLAQTVAAEVAVERATDFPDGVWWVELAPLSDPALVPAAVARVLDTQLPASHPPIASLAGVLAPQRALLVLDNCEHLSDEVAALVEAIRESAAGVRLLVTSQETLKTTEEHVYRIGALSVPVDQAATDALQSGAVELFVARAQAADPRFELGQENVAAVTEICRRLDGIPLAIELAAARLPLLGIEGLRARLGERFNLLTAGTRMVLRRHQTLRATLEWSHALLTPDEQTAFRRLGVFSGSFALETAQHVVSDERIDAWAALDLLGALVDKSLVLAEGDPVPRYRLLETTRAYAVERLAEAGETDSHLRKHAEAINALFACFSEHDELWKVKLADWIAAASELDNLRAAIAWASIADDAEDLAIALATTSYRVWMASAQTAEGMQRCLAVQHRIRPTLPQTDQARFWLTIARLGLYTTRRESFDAAVRAADLYRQTGDKWKLYDALVCSAVQGYRFATKAQMEAAITEAAALEQADWPGRQRLQFARFRWFHRLGKYEEALACAQRQVELSLEAGNLIGAHFGMSNITASELELGRTELALEHALASIAELERIGAGAGAGHLYTNVLVALIELGRVDEALIAGRTAHALLLREGDEIRVMLPLALCAARQRRLADAARVYGYVDAELSRTGALVEAGRATVRGLLQPLLEQEFGADEFARLRAEGAKLSEEQAFRLAVGDAH